ncbi:MAG: uncharacterized protein QOG19_2782 [Mycobacterium sp.]|jgi:uncharacterized protein YggE|nr:uncharacterized protein [Mycobacterium sp.]
MRLHARAKMPTRFLVIAAAGLAVIGIAACDSTSGPSATSTGETAPRQVTVVGSGEVQGTPDTLTANVSLEASAPDATAALNETSGRTKAVIDALVGSGIDRKDVSTSQVNLRQQFGDDAIPIGYTASNSLTVKIRKIDAASNALGLIATTGGNNTRINSVNFTIEDDSQLVKDARARAFNDAKDRATQYAELSGLDLGKVISISELPAGSGPTPPTPMPRAFAEAAPVPVEPGQQTVGFSVTVVWELDD